MKNNKVNSKITIPISKLSIKFADKINEIYRNFEKDEYEPLDGDGTENIAKLFLLELDILNGNITNQEYERKLKKINRLGFY